MIQSEFARYALVALIVAFTGFAQGITGFGATVLALPAVALLLGLKVAVPMLVLQGWVQAALVVARSPRHIAWREYALITVLMGVGMPLGMWAARVMPETTLKATLALLMILVGAHGLYLSYAQPAPELGEPERPPKPAETGWAHWPVAMLPLGGIIHGAFGTGGPLVVIYATRALTQKTVFRVTLCLMWVTLNSVLIADYARHAVLTASLLRMSGWCLPFTLVGLALGDVVHYRINETLFRRVVYGLLMLSGLALVGSLKLGH
jgi:uncharacterized membrane protein YfcA